MAVLWLCCRGVLWPLGGCGFAVAVVHGFVLFCSRVIRLQYRLY